MSETTAHNRIRFLVIISIALMAVFVVRLFYLQVIDHDRYVALAKSEQEKRLVIPAQRGEIFLMDGASPVKAVMNQTVYTMFVDPSIMSDKRGVIAAAREIVGGNTVKGFAERLDNDSQYEVVARQVTRTQAELVKKRGLKGVGFQAESKRDYPEKSLAAQTFGFVDAEGKGQYGVEGMFDKELQGSDGVLQTVTDVANVPLTIGNDNIDIPAKDGKDIVLSIDRNVQASVEKALADGLRRTGATNGSAIVMDPNTGKILSMANLPTYNPGKLSEIKNFSQVSNGVVSAPYEPGSVMKTFTMATGIDKGVVKPSSTYVNTDYIKIDDRTISNASKGQTGTITLQHALNWSLNTGMVTVAQRLGNNSIDYKSRSTMYQYLHDKFRLGETTGVEVAGEAKGRIISPDEADGNAVRYSNMSFGQGMDLTMVQVAAGFSAMVNGGTYHAPSAIAGSMNEAGEYVPNAPRASYNGIIKSSTSDQMRDMIVKARNAFYGKDDRKGYSIGGKTGTSQTIVNGSYENGQTVATYLGFGGDPKPKYVIMVQVSGKNKNLAGNKDAMPIFTDISNWMIDYLRLEPKA